MCTEGFSPKLRALTPQKIPSNFFNPMLTIVGKSRGKVKHLPDRSCPRGDLYNRNRGLNLSFNIRFFIEGLRDKLRTKIKSI